MARGSKKVGVGIVTYNRRDFLDKLLESVVLCAEGIDELVIVNDGDELLNIDLPSNCTLLQNDININVGASKNRAMRHLLDKGCEYIFTIEDDIIIKDKDIFNKYIAASKKTKLQHFNFGFSQLENLDRQHQPVYKKVIDYGDGVKLVLTENILGAFTFYTREALQTIGLHHKDFNKGHGDHLELTYRAYKHGFGSPFWWFADLYGSWDMIENQSNFASDSVVRNEDFADRFNTARQTFKSLHGCDIFEVPNNGDQYAINILKEIKNDG